VRTRRGEAHKLLDNKIHATPLLLKARNLACSILKPERLYRILENAEVLIRDDPGQGILMQVSGGRGQASVPELSRGPRGGEPGVTSDPARAYRRS
jgi:hypothetical protein